jgi:hypothetical protein
LPVKPGNLSSFPISGIARSSASGLKGRAYAPSTSLLLPTIQQSYNFSFFLNTAEVEAKVEDRSKSILLNTKM